MQNNTKNNIMIGYKATDNGVCNGNGQNPLKYEIGKTYTFNGNIDLCQHGFYYCEELKDVFSYYPPQPNLNVFKVEILGEVKKIKDKSVTDKLKIIEEVNISAWITFDERGNLVRNLNGVETHRTYDERNNLICENSCAGEAIHKFDENNNHIYSKFFDGSEQWREYDTNNNQISFKNSNGLVSKAKYDSNNNMIFEKGIHGGTTFRTFNENNKEIYSISMGTEKWYEYDENNHLIHFICSDNLGRRQECWHEYEGDNIICYKDLAGYEMRYKYDDSNRAIYEYEKRFDSRPTINRITYDQLGRLVSQSTAYGKDVQSTYSAKYDENDNIIYINYSEEGNVSEVWYEYDHNNSLISYRDSDGKEWSITIEE
jgi:hypothetical protein